MVNFSMRLLMMLNVEVKGGDMVTLTCTDEMRWIVQNVSSHSNCTSRAYICTHRTHTVRGQCQVC